MKTKLKALQRIDKGAQLKILLLNKTIINIGQKYKNLGLCSQIGPRLPLNFHSSKDTETRDCEQNLMGMLYATESNGK